MVTFVCPLLVVADLEKSRHFYATLLGQEVKEDHGENILFHGDFSLHLAAHFRALLGHAPDLARHHSMELYFETPNLEAVVRRLKAAGAEFLHPITRQPWGQRVVRVYDLDGHIVEIGEPPAAAATRRADVDLE